jgi:hypothetical protein
MAFGAPRCINCSGAVYHAEQAIGPAGKVSGLDRLSQGLEVVVDMDEG